MKIKTKILYKAVILIVLASSLSYTQKVSEIKIIRVGRDYEPTDKDILSDDFKNILANNRFVCYSPTNYDPKAGIFPPEKSIRKDLRLLKQYFNGIITYETTRVVPQIASKTGFKYCILGIWNPNSYKEIKTAIEQATREKSIIISIICGNEGLHRRYSLEQLKYKIQMLKENTGLPVTTTEESTDYSNPKVMALGDYLAVNAHPYYANKKTPEKAVQYVKHVYHQLQKKTNKFIVIKETGLPSGGDVHLDESSQAGFYRQMLKTNICFWWFESFDQEWKTYTPVEPFWGLFKKDREPKKIIDLLY